MAYGQIDPNAFKSDINPADQNSMAIKAGYTGWSDYLNNNRGSSGGSSGQSTSTSPIGAGTSWEDTVRKAIDMQKQANQPTIASYQAQIPEIKSQYAAQEANVTAKAQTLKDRYDNLLKSIGTSKTEDVNKQTVVTSNELGKRGLLPSSTLAQQEVLNATTPINQKYAGLETTAALDQTSGQQELQSLLNQLTSGQTSDTRNVLNAIAQLESGAATSGMTLGSNLYGSEQTRIANQTAADYKSKQDAITNQIAQAQLANQTAETKYKINEPYKTNTIIPNPFLQNDDKGTQTKGWVNSSGATWNDTNKTPVGTVQSGNYKGMTAYQDKDGNISYGKTVWTYK